MVRSQRSLAAEAMRRISVFMSESGLVELGPKYWVPSSVVPVGFFGRHTNKVWLRVCPVWVSASVVVWWESVAARAVLASQRVSTPRS